MKNQDECTVLLLKILKVIGGTIIGLYSLYLGISLLIIGLGEGFEFFNGASNKNLNLFPGTVMILLGLLITLTSFSDRPKKTISKEKVQKNDTTLININLLMPIMFIIGVILATVYILKN